MGCRQRPFAAASGFRARLEQRRLCLDHRPADFVVTHDDVLQHLTALCATVDLPVNADFGSGFASSPDELAGNFGRLIKTGVAGFSIEDRVFGRPPSSITSI